MAARTVTDWVQVESIGEGVTSVQVGDHVIPLYTAGLSMFYLRVFFTSDDST